MSIQLILFPQSYNGLNPISTLSTEFVVDGINFNTINTSPTSLSLAAPTYQSAIDALNATMLVNTWYRFSSIGSPPTETGGTIGMVAQQGIIQKLSNLVIGQSYDVTIETTASTLTFYVYSGTIQQSSTAVSIVGTNSFQFTATSTTNTIVVYSIGISAVTSISIKQAAQIPSGAIHDLRTGQVIVDLYEDEDIPLTLSVDDFKNVAEQVQSYSKAFNLPATKRNNQIFDNIFEITRNTSELVFNPYIKTQCQLKQDGFILFEGYLRLIDIQDKEGEISYDVNLYSEVIALADVLQDRTFSELDFSELTHDYNYTEIRNSWQGILGLTNNLPVGTFAGTAGTKITDVLRYPFVDWNHSYTIGTNGGPALPNLESSFRPFISIKYLIQNIFSATNVFSYTSDFIDNDPDFQKLYMDFNWGAENAPVVFDSTGELTRQTFFNIGTSFTTIPFEDLTGNTISSNFGYSAGIFTAITDNQTYYVDYDFRLEASPSSPTDTLDIEWLVNGVSTNVVTGQSTPTSGWVYSGNFTAILNTGDTILCRAKCVNNTVQVAFLGGTFAMVTATTSSNQTTNDTLLGTLRGELGQWDFLKGIITMFNLVSVPDKTNPNNILIEPYKNMFLENSDSTPLDWTDKIDIAEMKLTPLTDLNKKTIFKFVEDDDDYAFNVYKNSVQGHLYGSKVWDASGFTVLEGEEEVIAEPFAATVPKALMDQFPDFIVPRIYSYNPDDDTSEGFDNSPRIMYNNGVVDLTSCTYFVPCQNQPAPCGDATEDQFLQFSHLTDIPTVTTIPPAITDTNDFHFGECQLCFGSNPTTNNLFGTYWLPYFNELYNADTRTMTLKVNLTAGDINTFKFYDTIFIKNRTFRCNRIDYKPNDLATVEFILIP